MKLLVPFITNITNIAAEGQKFPVLGSNMHETLSKSLEYGKPLTGKDLHMSLESTQH